MEMGTCTECDEDIAYDSLDCPECGLDNPVALKWYKESHEPLIKNAIKKGDLNLAVDLLFEAWYESGSMPDYYAWGETHRELVKLYKETEMHERLIFQLCYSATFYEHGSSQDGNDALEIAKNLGREDLELYCYREFDSFNWTYYKKSTPENMVDRVDELEQMVIDGKLKPFEPELDINMWKEGNSNRLAE
jgi:hypothetical protein